MRSTSAVIPRRPDLCFRKFTDPAVLAMWVPGLRKVRVVATDAERRALEIQFEFSTSLTYSLVYTYDPASHAVRWEPRAGKRDAVRGAVRFDPDPAGTRMTYELEHGHGRSEAERAIGEPQALVDAFVRWMQDEPAR